MKSNTKLFLLIIPAIVIIVGTGVFFANKSEHESSKQKLITATGTANEISVESASINIYAELLRGIERQYEAAKKYRGVVPKPDERLEKLKALGFTRIKNVNAVNDSIALIERANKQFETITHYRNKYPAYRFVHESKSFYDIRIDYSAERDSFLDTNVLYKIMLSYNMRIFEADKFTSMLPNSIIPKILAFDLSSIDTKDMIVASCVPTSETLMTISDYELLEKSYRKFHEAHKHEPYHDLDTQFKVLAPASEGVKIDDPIILFPVKHGYLIIAHWSYEAKQ